jgi:hypothetical protein
MRFPSAKRLKSTLVGSVLVSGVSAGGSSTAGHWLMGRTGQLGSVERLVRSGAESDLSADLGVDDGIASRRQAAVISSLAMSRSQIARTRPDIAA